MQNAEIRYIIGLIDAAEPQLKLKTENGIIVMGGSKYGKSTLVNAIVGEKNCLQRW